VEHTKDQTNGPIIFLPLEHQSVQGSHSSVSSFTLADGETNRKEAHTEKPILRPMLALPGGAGRLGQARLARVVGFRLFFFGSGFLRAIRIIFLGSMLAPKHQLDLNRIP
jgi:hypothetical protein